MGTPLELVKYNTSTGKFECGAEAIAALRRVKAKVGVVSVCGRARQGKSFILNQLLSEGNTNGFTVGPTHRPCTKGLWMWSTPQRRTAPDGSDYYLVLLDTEGIDAYDQTAQYSTQIFSLAVLLSSLFVYNQMGGIDEAALDRLSLVTEMTRHIRVRAGAGNSASASGPDASAELGEFTPAFLWLLRDFYLQLEEDGRKISPRDYLETALLAVPGNSGAAAAKNQIRASIKSLFPDRDCFTLVRPMNEESALVSLDRVPRSQLRPEFRAGVEALTRLIFAKAQPKRLGAQMVTGAVLAGLTEAYVKALNEGAVPTIATAWQGVAEAECRRAADAAEAKYASEFNAGVAAEEGALEAEHRRALAAGRVVFEEGAVGDERIRKAHESKFVTAVDARFQQTKARKLAEAQAAVSDMLYKAQALISSSVAQDGATIASVQAQMAGFIDQFARLGAGPTKWAKLVEFLKDMYPQVAQALISRSETAARADIQRLVRELHEAQAAAQQARDGAASFERRLQESHVQAAAAQAQASQLQAALGAAQEQAATLQRQKLERDSEVAQLRVAVEQHRSRCAALEAQLQEAFLATEKKLANAGEVSESRLRAAQADALAAAARADELTARLAAAERRAAEVAAELNVAHSKCRGLEAQVSSLSGERGDLAQRYGEAAAERAELVRLRDEAAATAHAAALERDAAMRERDAANRKVSQLESRLQAADAEMGVQLAQAAREALAAQQSTRGGHGAPPSPMNAGAGPSSPHYGGAVETPSAAGGSGGLSDAEINEMTIPDMKKWLMAAGHDAETWSLSNRKPAPKKSDWLALVKAKAQQA